MNHCVRYLWIGNLALIGWAMGSSAWAQITPDQTLPINSSVVPGCQSCKIDGGTVRDRNLFHSFEQFSVPPGGEAWFNNPVTIRNIFSRVTGAAASVIEGNLRANGTANLFFINPNGISFGKTARLQIGGSFLATTANGIQLGDRGVFSATNPQPPSSLLTVDPSALLLNQIATRPITSQATLTVPSGRSILLVGGDILLNGGQLNALSGRVELAGIAGVGTVGVVVADDRTVALTSVPDVAARANVSLINGAQINRGIPGTRFGIGGNIIINARTVDLVRSNLFSGPQGTLAGGTIVIDADAIALDNTQLTSATLGKGNAGDITLRARDAIVLTRDSSVSSQTRGAGNAGKIDIQAGAGVTLDQSRIVSATAGQGSSGDIGIVAPTLTLNNNAQVSAQTSGAGDAGKIVVQADRAIAITNSSLSSASQLSSGTLGNSGEINLQTGTLTVTGSSAGLFTSTAGDKNAGNITIHARDRATFTDNSQISSETLGQGRGGNIAIVTPSLVVTDSAIRTATGVGAGGTAGDIQLTLGDSLVVSRVNPVNFIFPVGLSTSTNGFGPGGTLIVTAGNAIDLSGRADGSRTGLFAATTGTGAGGNIVVQTRELTARDGAQISASTSNRGAAGDIRATVGDRLLLAGTNTGILANTTPGSTGKGGSIVIDPSSVVIRDGAKIAVNSQGTGDGGDIQLQAGRLTLDQQGVISAETVSSQGGDIMLQLGDYLLLRHGSSISTSAGTAQAGGNGGNITITSLPGARVAPFIISAPLENNDITANAFSGSGGRVTITAESILGLAPLSRQQLAERLGNPTDATDLNPHNLPTNDITAISQGSPTLNGTVTITTPDVDPSRGLTALPTTLTDPSRQITQGCAASAGRSSSSFVTTGRGGLPVSPDEPLREWAVLTQWVTLGDDRARSVAGELSVRPSPAVQTKQPGSANQAQTPTGTKAAIVEAQGVTVNAAGDVSLVVSAPTVTAHAQPLPATACQTP